MGWYVHIHVCFPCQDNEPVARLASNHLVRLRSMINKDDGQRAAELLGNGIGGICSHERIIVFEEQEQSEAASAYEISLIVATGDVSIRKHSRLPFSWMQM